MSSIITSITKFAVAKKADGEAFGPLRDAAANIQAYKAEDQVEAFDAECREAEVEFMETNYSWDQNAKTKGKREWKFRTYLPNAYSTSKAILRKGLEFEVPLTGKAKSQIEKEVRGIKKAEAENAPKDWQLVAKQHYDNLVAAIEKIAVEDSWPEAKAVLETYVTRLSQHTI